MVVCYGTHRGVFGSCQRQSESVKTREGSGELLGEKIPPFFEGINLGICIFFSYKVQGGNPKTKTAKQKLITLTPKLFTENKKHHHKETRKFLWSSLHNWFTISSSSKHCTQVGHGRAKNRDLLDPPLLWRRGSHLFRQQASEPRQQPCGNRWVDGIWYENSWNCCHFGRFFPSSTFVPIILTMFCTCVLGDGWIVWKNMYAATNWEEKSIGNEVRISCLSCVCFFIVCFFREILSLLFRMISRADDTQDLEVSEEIAWMCCNN